MKTSNDIMYDIPLPDSKLEKGKYVAAIKYQIPKRIILHGRSKTSPKFETLYGLIYWLNKQPYNLEFIIFRTDRDVIIKQGKKKAGEIIV
jgi:hypothetical protein